MDLQYPDIYFEPAYARLYLQPEEEAVEYRFENENGVISNLFIKRKIETLVNGQTFYDIITPYGYGGPIIKTLAEGADKQQLVNDYAQAFAAYAEENHIVSEFVRFHPVLGNALDFKEPYNAVYNRTTIGTNLTFDDVIGQEFAKHTRKDIRRILHNPDIHYVYDEAPATLDDFIEVYYSTMDRDGADEMYYFDRHYFQQMLDTLPGHIMTCKVLLGEKTIAMGVYFRYGKYLHAHLSGTISEYLNYSPAYILKYAMALYGHEKGYEVIHYGGGDSTDPENSLLKFKKKFGKNTEFDFYIGRKIWNEAAYVALCREKNVDPETTGFFPAYRA